MEEKTDVDIMQELVEKCREMAEGRRTLSEEELSRIEYYLSEYACDLLDMEQAVSTMQDLSFREDYDRNR